MSSSGKPRQERPLAEQHEEWIAHLRRHAVSRRTIIRGSVGAAAGSLLLGSGAWSDRAVAATLADTGTIAGGFVVNGRHLSFGNDPTTEMRVGGQLINLNQYNALPPRSVRVWVDYGADRSYGSTVEAEIRELLTHVPVWDGRPGVLRASRTLNADQFFAHGRMAGLRPGTQYHYRFRYASGGEVGVTADATFITAPRGAAEPFTFTAFADEGIPGPSLDRDPSLLPESDWGMWNNGSYDSEDPDRPSVTGVDTTTTVISQITKVRNLTNGTPARFNLLAGDLCYAQAQGDIQPIINPDGPGGKQPSTGNTPQPPANSGGWDYYDPWIWTSWFPMIEPSAASIPWMFATGNHEPELFSSHVAADHVTVANYEPIGYGGLIKRMDLPTTGPSACPSVYSFSYGNVGIVSLDANDLSWEIQGLLGYSKGAQVRWLEGVVGTAGTPRYGWTGKNQTDRNFGAGTGSGSTVVGDANTQVGPWINERDFSLTYETIDWSQARYDDYGFIALDVTPASIGMKTTMVLRFINEQGRELDRVVFSRIAGA